MTKNKPTYLFYDTETTGLNRCFDQAIQFAAIRTDLELNELERYETFIKLNKDVVPSPLATITHRISLNECNQGLPEIEAMQTIHQQLNTPGTISVGYNTLGFDDEFLRFSFYRNLLPPYTHQYANECGRMDLYPITVMYHLYKPEVLTYPIINGNPSLKLEHLNQANQLAAGKAHNAMVDVEVTLALARRLKQENEMWQYVIAYFDKKTDRERLNKLNICFKTNDRVFHEGLMVSGALGYKNKFIAPVLSLGQHKKYSNQTMWLRLDQEEIQNCTADNIAEKTFVIRKRAAEQELLLPTLERFAVKVDKARAQLAENNKQWLQEHSDILEKMCDYHQNFMYAKVDNIDIDAALYDIGFPSPREELLFRQFHQATVEEKLTIAAEFPNVVRREQALRLLGRHYSNTLSDKNLAKFNTYLNSIKLEESRIDYKNQRQLTLSAALSEIEALLQKEDLDAEQKNLLEELQQYYLNSVS